MAKMEKFAHEQALATEEAIVKAHTPRIAQIEEELSLMFQTFSSFRDKHKSDSVLLE
jgi:hypothetical protein